MECFEGIEIARGYFEAVTRLDGEFVVHGWMLLPNKEFDSVQFYWNGDLVDSAEIAPRKDVGEVFPWIPHASQSGFSVRLSKQLTEKVKVGHIDLLGCREGKPLAHMSSLFRTDIDTGVPVPPAALMERVAGSSNPRLFTVSGLTPFTEFFVALSRHCDLSSVHRLLDWGCGCGRVSMHFLHFLSGAGSPEFYGCDIDGEAITWCAEHFRSGKFTRIEPWPPTPYEDATFDVAVGNSVFTHLQRDAQTAWLAEMKRIIAPGGLFLASTHGEFAAYFTFRDKADYALRNGISDDMPDSRLDGIAPDGYYRAVFQTRAYTEREWSKHFEILEYIERGMGHFQDLVVMRRRSSEL